MGAEFGAFGKISGLGDFLRLNLPGELVQPWDEWLQTGLLAAREALGAAWNDCYLSAPIWRFSLPGGVLGTQAAIGILMASVDRVGRQYPLTIVARCQPGNSALRHFAAAPLFTRLEDIALSTLDDHATREDLRAALEGLEPVAQPAASSVDGAYAGCLPPEHVLAALALRDRHGEVGIWTTQIGDDFRLLLSAGLPDARQFTALFDLDAALWPDGAMARSA